MADVLAAPPVRHPATPIVSGDTASTPDTATAPRFRLDPAWLAGHDPAPRTMETSARAIALANRLLDVEQQTIALRGQLARTQRELDSALAGTAAGTGGWFDVPNTRHPWPLAEQPERDPASLDQYDRRVDDPVITESRRGDAFLTRFALTTTAPQFAAAIGALNARPKLLDLIAPDSLHAPDVSIVIPVYGQLGYTLNCLDSLFAQVSRYSAEIIIADDRSPDPSTEMLPLVAGLRIHLQPANVGFIQNCNTGAALARGRYVLMLNNDTRVVPGWLDALLDSFEHFPAAGLVGSKLFYPDGSLQEAGGIIWRDGSCWNYGRNDDPNRPQYAHARQVDYVSGCSIALPTELWRQLGGFDPLFTPAYCEDADLALRISQRGRQVWLQPQSRVIHYEGKTGGTDTAHGVKAYQVINNRKLYLRWREPLERHHRNGEAPYFERERSVRRRALVVDVTAPTPKQDAGSVQTVLGLRVCRDLGYKTHFVAEDNWLFDPDYTTALQQLGVECACAPHDLGFTHFIRRYGPLFDVVLVYRMGVLERVIDDIRHYAPQAALLFHVADLHFLRRMRQAELENSPQGHQDAEAIKLRELALVAAADCTITHSIVERDILADEVPAAPVAVWPLMFDFFGTTAPFAARRDICFLGGYRHPPNVDAMSYFVAEVFPLIRHADPTIRLLIAGANAGPDIIGLARDGVEVLGQIDDLRDLFDRSRVFVAPLRFGAGVKGKIMSALSYGLPIVSSRIGIEGSGLIAGKHILVADTPAAFASATLQL